MGWQWFDEGEDEEPVDQPVSEQTFPGTIYERIDGINDSYRGDLSIVPLPRYYYFKKMSGIGQTALMLLQSLNLDYRPGQLISFSDIAEIGKKRFGFDERKTKIAMSRLWAKGYVNKWAEGVWREGFLSRSKGKVGQYYGVHYELKEQDNV